MAGNGLRRQDPSAGPHREAVKGLGRHPLDHDFLRAYRKDWKPRAGEVVDLGVATEPPVQPVEPWPVQRDALDALEATRAEGYTAGLVVMAAGLGKTWVAANDGAHLRTQGRIARLPPQR